MGKVYAAMGLDSNIDTLLGYSEGGSTIGYWLLDARGRKSGLLDQISRVILIEPSFNWLGPDNLDANEFPGITFVTRNGDSIFTRVHGTVANNPNSFYDNGCNFDVSVGYHCTHETSSNTAAAYDVDVAFGICFAVGAGHDKGIACGGYRSWHR